MYLLPTMEEINKLRRAINPTAQIMDYLYSRPPAEGSMAEFFMESEDIELAMEDDCTEFDYIEDEILNMKRDINGFRIHVPAPEYMEYARGTDSVNYRGKIFEYIVNDKVPDGPNLKQVSSWDEI
jgi:hypothetical protein